MDLRHLPLLEIHRELYGMPRGMERFRAYLQRLTGGTSDLSLPLVAMNPMGKAHMLAAAEAWIAAGVEEAAAQAVADAAARLDSARGVLRVGLVLGDDVKGGWTNRFTTDFAQRFESAAMLRRDFATALLWSSEPPSRETARREVLRAIARALWERAQGPARSLRQMLAQEDDSLRFAGAPTPDRSRYAPWLDATDAPTLFACLYGDDAAASLGYAPLGVEAAL